MEERLGLCLTLSFAVLCLKEYDFCIVCTGELQHPQFPLIFLQNSHWNGVSTPGFYLEVTKECAGAAYLRIKGRLFLNVNFQTECVRKQGVCAW